MYLIPRKLKDLGAGTRVPNYIFVIIEVSAGSDVEYIYDEDLDLIVVNKVLRPPLRYSFNRGFIPGTRDVNGELLRSIVLSEHSFEPGSLVESKPLGVLNIQTKDLSIEEVVSVPHERIDPVYGRYKDINDLSKDLIHKITDFINRYYGEHRSVGDEIMINWRTSEYAKEKILESVKRASLERRS